MALEFFLSTFEFTGYLDVSNTRTLEDLTGFATIYNRMCSYVFNTAVSGYLVRFGMEGHSEQRFDPMAYNEADHSGRTENVPPATARCPFFGAEKNSGPQVCSHMCALICAGTQVHREHQQVMLKPTTKLQLKPSGNLLRSY